VRARVIELEGTEEEILRTLAELRGPGDTPGLHAVEGADRSSDLPDALLQWFRHWDVRGPQRQYIEDVVREVLSWGDVELRILGGRGQDQFSGRIRFVKSDQREAFGILGRRGVLYLHLPKETDVSRFTYAKRRDTKTGRHPVRMFVRSPEAVTEATELLRVAHDSQGRD
jgi:hypothetical protein